MHQKHAIPRTQELMSRQIEEVLDIVFELPVPGTKILHTVTCVLGDVSNGDTPLLGYYAGVLYQLHSNNSPVNVLYSVAYRLCGTQSQCAAHRADSARSESTRQQPGSS